MPPKSAKSTSATKAELQQKIRAIQMKQQKWLQERQLLLKAETPKKDINLGSNSNENQGRIGKSPTTAKNETAEKTDLSPNSGFHTWISNRKQKDGSQEPEQLITESTVPPEYDPSNYHDNSNCDHTEVPPLRLPSSCSQTMSIASKDTEDDEGWNSAAQSDALSPDRFDALADKIVNRVRRELNLERRQINSPDSSPPDQDKADDVEANCTGNDKPCDISSHKCPVCHRLMVPPLRYPLLLIPCGHTSCQSCVKDSKSCRLCNHHIQSSTTNIMLQQIITDYHQGSLSDDKKQSHDMPTRAKRSQVENNNPQVNQLGKTYSYIPSEVVVPQTPRKSAEEYEEEYNNLLLRCDILRDEEEAICQKMVDLEKQEQGQLQQIDNISNAQRRLQQDIEKIQQQIQALDEHKQGYRLKIEDLQAERKKERRRLEMTRSTINQLKSEINKIKKELTSAN